MGADFIGLSCCCSFLLRPMCLASWVASKKLTVVSYIPTTRHTDTNEHLSYDLHDYLKMKLLQFHYDGSSKSAATLFSQGSCYTNRRANSNLELSRVKKSVKNTDNSCVCYKSGILSLMSAEV